MALLLLVIPKLETTQISIKIEWIKKAMIYTYNEILHSYKKAMITVIYNNMDEINNHYEQKKSETKEYISVPSSGGIFILLCDLGQNFVSVSKDYRGSDAMWFPKLGHSLLPYSLKILVFVAYVLYWENPSRLWRDSGGEDQNSQLRSPAELTGDSTNLKGRWYGSESVSQTPQSSSSADVAWSKGEPFLLTYFSI